MDSSRVDRLRPAGLVGKRGRENLRKTSRRRLPEKLVPRFEPFPIGPMMLDPRQPNQLSIEALESVHKHRTIGFMQDVLADFNAIVRPNGDQVRVKRGMMQGAQRDAVGDSRRPALVPIGDDVCSLEKLVALEAADGAMTLVGLKHALAELLLVQSLLHQPGRIPLTNCRLN